MICLNEDKCDEIAEYDLELDIEEYLKKIEEEEKN